MTAKFSEEKREVNHILRIFQALALLGMLAASLGPANAAMLQGNQLCVAVSGGDTANNTSVIGNTCSGGFPQQWNFVKGQLQGIGSGSASGPSTCLTVQGAGTAAGTPLILYQCNGGLNQLWQISNNGEIVGTQSSLCVDSAAGLGNQLVINPCSGGKSQTWIVR